MTLADTRALDTYDAFISYRSARSGEHARQLRGALAGLHSYRSEARPLRVFLDRISLRAGELDDRIIAALRVSRHLIVVLDRTTHESNYVNMEIQEWRAAGGSPDRLFLVRTDAELDLGWDDETGNFRNPDALPPALSGIFSGGQKYIDFIVPPRRVGQIDIVGLYCAIRNDADPERLGIDARVAAEKKRAFNRLVIIVLSVLLVLAIIAGGLAVTNFLRADQSAKQARADALAAESLLTLPVSPAHAIDLAVRSAQLGDGPSIRSSMLAVAADSSHLRGTMSLTAHSQATSLAGLSLSTGDSTLTAWGPTADSSTDVVTWETASRQAMQQFTIPRRKIDALVEIPGVAYLACAEQDRLRIDWRTHEVRVLDTRQDDCLITSNVAGAAIVNHTDNVPAGEIIAVSITGQEFRTTGSLSTDRGRRSIRTEITGNDGVVTGWLTANGIVPIPEEHRGIHMGSDDETTLLRGNDGRFHTLSVDGSEVVHAEFTPPENPTRVIGWRDWKKQHRIAWLTAEGELGWSGGSQTIHLSDDTTDGGTVPGPSLARFSATGVGVQTYGVATFGSSVFGIEATDERFRAVRVPAKLPNQQWSSSPLIRSCDQVAVIGDIAYLTREGLVLGSADLKNCQAVEAGPPLRVNGQEVVQAAYAEERLLDVTNDGEIYLALEDGTISHFSGIEAGTEPWRITRADSVMTSDDGSVLFRDAATGSELVRETGSEVQALAPGITGTWLLPSPDGQGALLSAKDRWLVTPNEFPRMLKPACQNIRFEPAPGFLTDARAAQTQQVVGDETGVDRLDCLTGRPLPPGPTILTYRIGQDLGLVLSNDEGTVRLTSWRPGDSRAESSELPGNHEDANHAVVSTTGDRIALGANKSAELAEYRRSGDIWTRGHRYATTAGQIGAAAYSPDGTLLIIASPQGHFDIFDTGTGRRLASQRTPLAEHDQAFSRLSVRERDGYLVANLQSGSKGRVIEIPVGVVPLRALLCNVHPAESC